MPIFIRPISKELAATFMPQIERRTMFAERGCIELSGSEDTKGYGRVWRWVNGRTVIYRAHRIVWAYHNGGISGDVLILHKCDNRRCINREHLFDGTPKINTHDAMEKGRFANGERHGCAKITEDQAISAKERYANGGISCKSLGKEIGVSESQMHAIIQGRRWGHLELRRRATP